MKEMKGYFFYKKILWIKLLDLDVAHMKKGFDVMIFKSIIYISRISWHFWVVHVHGWSGDGIVFFSGLLLNKLAFMQIRQ